MTVDDLSKDADHQILVISVGLYKMFLANGKLGQEGLSMYMHLMFTARLQKTNQVWANEKYLATGLKWGLNKVRKIKAFLHRKGLIEYVQKAPTAENPHWGRTYIRLPYLWSKKTIEKRISQQHADDMISISSAESTDDINSISYGNHISINALNKKKRNALNKKNDNDTNHLSNIDNSEEKYREEINHLLLDYEQMRKRLKIRKIGFRPFDEQGWKQLWNHFQDKPIQHLKGYFLRCMFQVSKKKKLRNPTGFLYEGIISDQWLEEWIAEEQKEVRSPYFTEYEALPLSPELQKSLEAICGERFTVWRNK